MMSGEFIFFLVNVNNYLYKYCFYTRLIYFYKIQWWRIELIEAHKPSFHTKNQFNSNRRYIN